MKKYAVYIADALTISRLFIAALILICAFAGISPEWAFWLFVAGEGTDAFDGMAARRWPFPAGQEPWYRKLKRAEVYEEIADVILGITFLVYATINVDTAIGISLLAFSLVGGIVTEFIAWGRLFGSDIRHSAHCFYAKNPSGCDRLVLIRRGVYLAVVAFASLVVLLGTTYPPQLKTAILATACVAGSALLILKKNRLTQPKTR